MNTKAFQRWMGRTGLVAALFLLLVPTTTRLLEATHGGHDAYVTHGLVHDGAHARHGLQGGTDPSDTRPAIGDPDCDYCPLLAALVAPVPVLFKPVALPAATAPGLAPYAPSIDWLHPNGLGSRGPPRVG